MISKKICEHLGGTITAESTLNHGCTFTFTIVLKETQESREMPLGRELFFEGFRGRFQDDSRPLPQN